MVVILDKTQENFNKLNKKKLLDCEWLDTNGIGGYSSSTIPNCHTRKYHGLLVASLKNHADRVVLLSNLDESLEVGENHFKTSMHYFEPGVYAPAEEMLELSFSQQLYPKWIYRGDGFTFTRELQTVHGENSTLIKFKFMADPKSNLKHAILRLKPLLAFKSFHQNNRENDSFNFNYTVTSLGTKFQPYNNFPELYINLSSNVIYKAEPCWYRNFIYQEEKNRGYDYTEDLASPIEYVIEFNDGDEFVLDISTEVHIDHPQDLWSFEADRREFAHRLIRKRNSPGLINRLVKKQDLFLSDLSLATSQFIIKPNEQDYSVIAGYHWFGEWGRDTMISLPGLLLDTNQNEVYKKIIRRFLDYQNNGLIPNIIGKPPAYNSVDASLWLFWAVQQLGININSYFWIKEEFEIWDNLKMIFSSYANGKAKQVRCLVNGLIESGSESDSLSWMDACVDGHSVIPRYGLLVEINALWYNAVSFIKQLAKLFNDPIYNKAASIQKQIEESFTPTFLSPDKTYLGDFVCHAVLNTQIRPNQIFAVSLPFSPVSPELAKSIVKTVSVELFTPYGLRTLSPKDVNYKGHYQGDVKQRDQAYHNGTVWPWLMGSFTEALLKVSEDKTSTKKYIRELLSNLEKHFYESGTKSIAEIFDGDAPHQARGCIAQAWSVAEIRRILLQTA